MGKEGNGRDDVFGFEKCTPLRRSMTDELLVENSEKFKAMEKKIETNLNFLWLVLFIAPRRLRTL